MSQLTVGLPVYNAMPYLPETVNSLLAQSRSDFDILIIDDGSTDGSGEYLDSLTDPRFRVFHQENSGLTATLNRMLTEVRTPWLVRQDADDIAYPDRIKIIAEYIGRYPEAGMFYSLADYYPKGASVGTFRTTVANPGVLRNLSHAGYLLAICHPTVCLNVEKTMKLGGYRFDLHVEDADLWWRMALAYDIQLIQETLIGFRHNAGSVSHSNLEIQTINALYIQYLLVSHLWGQTELPYEQAVAALEVLLDRKRLRFRELMRQANVEIGKRNRCRAVGNVMRAFAASPSSFFKRLTYEFSGSKPVVNGVEPVLFALNSERLWPGAL
jgi:glycosyltransferase involved in cell wall biosynthesis